MTSDQHSDKIVIAQPGRVRRDSDGMVAYHYCKSGRTYRRCLFRVVGNDIYIQDPGSREQVLIGHIIDAERVELYVFI